jgi:cell shape-determining protein MreC
MLKQYELQYQQLKKENNTLSNQLDIIDREKEELR